MNKLKSNRLTINTDHVFCVYPNETGIELKNSNIGNKASCT